MPKNLALIEATSFFWCCYCEERGNDNTKKRYSRKQENRFIKRPMYGFKSLCYKLNEAPMLKTNWLLKLVASLLNFEIGKLASEYSPKPSVKK